MQMSRLHRLARLKLRGCWRELTLLWRIRSSLRPLARHTWCPLDLRTSEHTLDTTSRVPVEWRHATRGDFVYQMFDRRDLHGPAGAD